VSAPVVEPTGRPASCRASISASFRPAVLRFFSHTPVGCPLKTAVVGARRWPCSVAHPCAADSPSAKATLSRIGESAQ
jgi:hypothetical protein